MSVLILWSAMGVGCFRETIKELLYNSNKTFFPKFV